jgi:hypothetical protein
MTRKNDRDSTVVHRRVAPKAGIHEQSTAILKRKRSGPDDTTERTKVDGIAALAQDRKRAAAGHPDVQQTPRWHGRETDTPRQPRGPDRAGPIAVGPPPPTPSRRG